MNAAETKRVLADVEFRGWTLVVEAPVHSSDWWLQWRFAQPCSRTGVMRVWSGRKWRLSAHMTETELVNTAWLAAHGAVVHEACEAFKYQGVTVFDPHVRIADRVYVRDNFPLDSRESPETPAEMEGTNP